jgi:hypothetical protein
MVPYASHRFLSGLCQAALAWSLGMLCCAGQDTKHLGQAVSAANNALNNGWTSSVRRLRHQIHKPTPVKATPFKLVHQHSDSSAIAIHTGDTKDIEAHVDAKLAELDQETEKILMKHVTAVNLAAGMKEQEGMAVIEEELPLAALNDTTAVTEAMRQQEKDLKESQDRSAGVARDAIIDLKAKTEKAVNLSVMYEVRTIEQEALTAVKNISAQTATMRVEANALAAQVNDASQYNQKAFDNSEMWVNQLPKAEAAKAHQIAEESKKESMELVHETWSNMRTAKLAGNFALDTIRLTGLAQKYLSDAEVAATKTSHQAAQNAKNLVLANDLIQSATQTAQKKLAR